MKNAKLRLSLLFVAPIAIAASIYACGGDGGSGCGGISGAPADIVGTWTGTWNDPLYSVTGRTIQFTITDNGGTLSGTAMVQDQGSPTPISGTITGTLTATAATFTVDFSTTMVTLTFDGTTLSLDGMFATLSPFDIEAAQTAAGVINSCDVVLTDGTPTEGTFIMNRM